MRPRLQVHLCTQVIEAVFSREETILARLNHFPMNEVEPVLRNQLVVDSELPVASKKLQLQAVSPSLRDAKRTCPNHARICLKSIAGFDGEVQFWID